MCIIYDHKATQRMRNRKVKTITVYKVYKVTCYDGEYSLRSPYYCNHSGSVIKKAGTYRASNVYSEQKAIGKMLYGSPVTKKALVKFSDAIIDVYGFHCFLKRDEAVVYAMDLGISIGVDGAIVPLKVNINNMVIAGKERVSNQSDGVYSSLYLKTATFTRITISEQTLKSAFNKRT